MIRKMRFILLLGFVLFVLTGQQICLPDTNQPVRIDYTKEGGNTNLSQALLIVRNRSNGNGLVSYESNFPQVSIENSCYPAPAVNEAIVVFENNNFCELSGIYPSPGIGVEVFQYDLSYTLGNGSSCRAIWSTDSNDLPRGLLSIQAYLEQVKEDLTREGAGGC